ncbi:MAG: NADH-quinone oxidoreductase subunit NuoK [Chloroflexi bacterium]|nr:NADH-quinone oxidoreductase subunit NuoK [Chloroflexota bacterium]
MTLNHFLVLSALLFCLGLYGALAKRNAVAILMGIELMFNAVNVALVAFSRFGGPATVAGQPVLLAGQAFVVFILTVAAAEAALGLAIIFAIYRRRETIDADRLNLLKW